MNAITIFRKPIPVEISVYCVAVLALCFAMESARRIGVALLFAALHELGHLAALAACRAGPRRIRVSAAGVRMEAPPGIRLSYAQEIGIALAGPALSLALAGACLLLRTGAGAFWDTACWINLGFGLFNLLPVRQLDGGRALYAALCARLAEPTARRIVLAASLAALFLMTTLLALQMLRHAGTRSLGARSLGTLSLALAVVYLALCC